MDNARGAAPGLDDARVMVVDDNRVNRTLLAALLERGGIQRVETAGDGDEAIARLESFRPDLILLDLMMPNLDGFAFTRHLRATPAWADLPVLVQSGLDGPGDRARAFAAGATDYVAKPINAAELLARVRIHLQNRALLDDLRHFRRRSEAELALARRVQERLMPEPRRWTALDGAGVRVDAHVAPSSELGGDIWDLRQDGAGRPIVQLADFSGHGVAAALNTFRLHAITRQTDVAAFDPAAFLSAINRRLCPLLPSGQFATMLAGVLDPDSGCFRYAAAGWTRPMAWGPGDAEPRLGDGSGLPLGLLEQASYETRSLAVPPGGRLFLFSDAAIEIPVGDGVLEETGLARLVAGCAMDDPDGAAFLARLCRAMADTGPIDDDLTAVLLTREG